MVPSLICISGRIGLGIHLIFLRLVVGGGGGGMLFLLLIQFQNSLLVFLGILTLPGLNGGDCMFPVIYHSLLDFIICVHEDVVCIVVSENPFISIGGNVMSTLLFLIVPFASSLFLC